MVADPTTLGDHRYDDQLARRDAAAIEAYTRERDGLLTRIEALAPATYDERDRITHALLRDRLRVEQALDVCRFHEWRVDSGGASLFGELAYLVELHTVASAGDAANLVARMRQGAALVDDTIANLGAGLASGRVVGAEKVRRAIEQLETELARPAAEWAMARPAWAAQHAAHAEALRDVVERDLAPAFARYRDFLRDRVLPKARVDREGLAGLPDADAAYRATILEHVGLAMTPEELHELGRREIARTDRELAALGARVLGTKDLAETIARLREDRSLYFATREEILDVAGRCLERANAATPRVFGTLPKTPCVMREVPAYEAPYTTIAYYRQPHYDGSKPGEYFVNTYRPETRPRFELEALSWHEAVPGHHTQIALAQELGELPMFRKLEGNNAYVEGWALYTERLADELGLYSSDLDRIGMVSYDAWRCARLVVDTGLHHLGWSRAEAEAFMHAHTALTPVNISNEVDRYIGWPGQALSYKVGQLEISALRREAEDALKGRFSLPAFHDAILGAGAVTLAILRERLGAWTQRSR